MRTRNEQVAGSCRKAFLDGASGLMWLLRPNRSTDTLK
jgi:hypothetical protein